MAIELHPDGTGRYWDTVRGVYVPKPEPTKNSGAEKPITGEKDERPRQRSRKR
jgi:hypothetical protein